MNSPVLSSYRFSSDAEPTDEQLKKIMKEVSQEAKRKYQMSFAHFQEELRLLCLSKRR